MSVAQSAVQQDLGPFGSHTERDHAAPHPVRRLFGESRSTSWPAIILLMLLALMVVRPMIMSVLSFHRTAGLLTERRAEVATLQSRHDELASRKAYYETDAFIAERGREYGLVMPGETAFVIRELARPEAVGTYAQARLANATVDADVASQQ
jgi:cell division protein FtsB